MSVAVHLLFEEFYIFARFMVVGDLIDGRTRKVTDSSLTETLIATWCPGPVDNCHRDGGALSPKLLPPPRRLLSILTASESLDAQRHP